MSDSKLTKLLSVGEVHDMLANFCENHNLRIHTDSEDPNELEDPENIEMLPCRLTNDELIAKWNAKLKTLREMFAQLDSEFHDDFGCQ